jgi:hypothetical protein
VRLSRCEVRDHINYRKNDRWPSYRFYRALQRLKSPMRYVCEIFGTPRFSSFSTQSTQGGHLVSAGLRPTILLYEHVGRAHVSFRAICDVCSLRSLAKKHLNCELRTVKFGAGYLAPCPTIRRSLPAFPDKRTISEPIGMSQTCQIGDIAPKRPPNKAPYVVGRDGQSRQANMMTRNAVDYRPISMISQTIKKNATQNSGE